MESSLRSDFATCVLSDAYDVLAPDGSEVRLLLGLAGGGMAHFRLPPGQTSLAVMHRTVEEIWFVVSGAGEMWRKQGDRDEIVTLVPGVCLTIPLGTRFQFRSAANESIEAIGVTMPPWPGADEAIIVSGQWEPTYGGPTEFLPPS